MKRLSLAFLALLLLAPVANAEQFTGMYRIDARYGAMFQSCADGAVYDIAEDNASLKLESFYESAKIPRGSELFLRIDGTIEEHDSIPMLTIDTVRDLSTKQNCAATAEGASLENTIWKLERIGFREMPHSRATLMLDAATSTASGSTGCNRYTASYALDGSHLTFAAGAMTRMACVDAGMEDEQRFMDALAAASEWQLAGDHLALLNNRDDVVLEFSAQHSAE